MSFKDIESIIEEFSILIIKKGKLPEIYIQAIGSRSNSYINPVKQIKDSIGVILLFASHCISSYKTDKHHDQNEFKFTLKF